MPLTDWWKDFKRIIVALVVIFSLLFGIFIVNQFILLYQFLAMIHPWLALIVVGGILLAIVWMGYRLMRQLYSGPQLLEMDPDASEEEYDEYLSQLIEILKKNPNLESIDFTESDESQEDLVHLGFQTLADQSLPLIKQNANAIFLTTAISQNGALDTFVVLFSLTRMVWQLARFYRTRPSLKSLVKLYVQVASVIVMARTIEDADLIESQLEPLIAAILGESVASAIPGMVPITNLIVSSLMEGSINAFLTLRVGLITQEYLSADTQKSKLEIRRSATTQSLTYMATIIKDNSKTVVKSMGNAVKKAGMGTAKRWLKFNNDKV